MVAMGEVYYTKVKHGSLPLTVLKDGFLLGDRVYETERSLFEELYGKGSRMTLDRYFKKPKSKPSVNLAQFIMDECGVKKGIDLENRAHEVRKLFYAGFGARCVASGYNPEDVLQEIYKGLIARNRGICPFDPRKSTFGHYVHMVCGCIIANYHRKAKRTKEHESVGLFAYGGEDSSWGLQEVSAYAVEVDEMTPEENYMENEARDSLDGYIRKHDPKLLTILDGLIKKESRKSMAQRTGWSSSQVTQSVKQVRRLTLEWSERY